MSSSTSIPLQNSTSTPNKNIKIDSEIIFYNSLHCLKNTLTNNNQINITFLQSLFYLKETTFQENQLFLIKNSLLLSEIKDFYKNFILYMIYLDSDEETNEDSFVFILSLSSFLFKLVETIKKIVSHMINSISKSEFSHIITSNSYESMRKYEGSSYDSIEFLVNMEMKSIEFVLKNKLTLFNCYVYLKNEVFPIIKSFYEYKSLYMSGIFNNNKAVYLTNSYISNYLLKSYNKYGETIRKAFIFFFSSYQKEMITMMTNKKEESIENHKETESFIERNTRKYFKFNMNNRIIYNISLCNRIIDIYNLLYVVCLSENVSKISKLKNNFSLQKYISNCHEDILKSKKRQKKTEDLSKIQMIFEEFTFILNVNNDNEWYFNSNFNENDSIISISLMSKDVLVSRLIKDNILKKYERLLIFLIKINFLNKKITNIHSFRYLLLLDKSISLKLHPQVNVLYISICNIKRYFNDLMNKLNFLIYYKYIQSISKEFRVELIKINQQQSVLNESLYINLYDQHKLYIETIYKRLHNERMYNSLKLLNDYHDTFIEVMRNVYEDMNKNVLDNIRISNYMKEILKLSLNCERLTFDIEDYEKEYIN